MKGDVKFVREDGVKVSILMPKKSWNSATGHIYCYVGLGGRGAAKGRSTKTFQI